MTGGRLHVLVYSLDAKTNKLPNGLEVSAVYTDLKRGSKSIPVVLRNMTGSDITLNKGDKVAQVQTTKKMPKTNLHPGTLEVLDEEQGITRKLLTRAERQDKVMKELNLEALNEWPEELAQHVRDLIQEYHNVFLLDKNKLGCTNTVKHKIEIDDGEPFKEHFRCIPPPLLDKVREHIDEMLEAGAIRPSNSPWCNVVVLVCKKDGGLCFCIDFRKLNAKTKKDSYPLSHIQETLDSLVGARVFLMFDIKSGFWEIMMDEDSKQYTAFTVGNLGFFECERMPFGLCNVPASLMQNCLGELNLTYCLIYLDDVIIYAKDEGEHLNRLRTIFERFRRDNLKLKPSKCNLFQKEITYLAHDVPTEGIRPSKAGLKAVAESPEPTNYIQIRAFVGFGGPLS